MLFIDRICSTPPTKPMPLANCSSTESSFLVGVNFANIWAPLTTTEAPVTTAETTVTKLIMSMLHSYHVIKRTIGYPAPEILLFVER